MKYFISALFIVLSISIGIANNTVTYLVSGNSGSYTIDAEYTTRPCETLGLGKTKRFAGGKYFCDDPDHSTVEILDIANKR